MDPPTICRACMSTISLEYIDLDTPINNTTCLDIFNFCTKLQASLTDDLPINICNSCGTALQIAYEFIKNALEADQILRSKLNLQKDEPVEYVSFDIKDADEENADVLNQNFEIIEISETKPKYEDDDDNYQYSEQEREETENKIGDVFDDDETLIEAGVEKNPQYNYPQSMCPYCKKHVKLVELHIKRNHPEFYTDDCLKTNCPYCDKQCKLVNLHIKRKHPGEKSIEDYNHVLPTETNDETSSCSYLTSIKEEKDALQEDFVSESICPYCNKHFKFLKRHIKKNHPEEIKTSIRKHTKRNDTPKGPYPCPRCEKVFKRTSFRNKHEFNEHNKCNHCDYTSTNYISWLWHRNNHLRGPYDNNYLCSQCPAKFRHPKGLAYHEDYKHGNKETAFQCEKCGKKFINKMVLKSHILNKHTIGRSYQCKECGKAFKSQLVLNVHMKYHFKRQVPCLECDKKFVSFHEMKIHLRSHTGELPFECHLCNKRFPIKVRLTYHLQRHMGVKHKCLYCSEEFSSKAVLRVHTFNHIGMPYVCDNCGRGFAIRERFVRHSKSEHGIILTAEELQENLLKNSKNVKRGLLPESELISKDIIKIENGIETETSVA